MARQFTKVKADAFENLQVNAGILLNKFDITGVTPVADADIISATTGGISATCVASYEDLADGVDNAPANLMEFKSLVSWECNMSTTLIGASLETIKMMLGAADIDEVNGKVTPRANLKLADFTEVWWVGDRADGGMYAINLKNALSSDGFSIQTNDKGKGEFSLNLMGHVSLDAQDEVPMTFYVADAPAP